MALLTIHRTANAPPADPGLPYRVAFSLQYAAVPDSVFIFENDVPISPTRFHVEGN